MTTTSRAMCPNRISMLSIMEYNQENLLKLYAENLSYTEIAKQLNVSPGAVSGKIYRLKKTNPSLFGQRAVGRHPAGKVFGRAIKPDTFMQPNKNTIVFKRNVNKSMTKNEMRAMLKQAVENTK